MLQRLFKALALVVTSALLFTVASVPAVRAADLATTAQSSELESAEVAERYCESTELTMRDEDAIMTPGETYVLRTSWDDQSPEDKAELQWLSTDESVATITQDGQLTAVGIGEARVMVYNREEPYLCAATAVSVFEAPDEETGIRLTTNTIHVGINRSKVLNALLAPSLRGSNVQWREDSSELGNVIGDSIAQRFFAHSKSGTGTIKAYVQTPSGEVKSAVATVVVHRGGEDYFDIDKNGVLLHYYGESAVVNIPEGVKEIGPFAFEGIFDIKSVSVPSSVRRLRAYAFADTAIENITFEDSEESPSQLTEVGPAAFRYTNVQHLRLPRSVVTIGEEALSYVYRLESLELGPNVAAGQLGYALLYATNLKRIEIDPANPYYDVADGVVFSKDHTRLALFPADRSPHGSYVVPNETQIIEDGAFKDCSLTSVTLPEGLRSIGRNAFLGCTMWRLVYPESVQVSKDILPMSNVLDFGTQMREITFDARKGGLPYRLVVRGGVDGSFVFKNPRKRSNTESAFFGEGMTRFEFEGDLPPLLIFPSTVSEIHIDIQHTLEVSRDGEFYVAASEGSEAWNRVKDAITAIGVLPSHLHEYTLPTVILSGEGITASGDGYAIKSAAGVPVNMTVDMTGGVPGRRDMRLVEVEPDGSETVLQDWKPLVGANQENLQSMDVTVTPTTPGSAVRVEMCDPSAVVRSATLTLQNSPAPVPNPTPDPAPQMGQWLQDSHGWWYRNPDGTFPSNAEVVIDGATYRFDERGYMRTGWVRKAGAWYFHGASGAQAVGWVRISSSWYYLNPDTGVMMTGWINDGSAWYYLAPSGAMMTGWINDGSAWYYLAPSGAMMTGWINDGSAWYYLAPSGVMVTGWVKVGSSWYYMTPGSGIMVTGWLKDGRSWYYLNPDSGAMYTGRHWIGGKWYAFANDGQLID